MIIKNYSQLISDNLTDQQKVLRKIALKSLNKAIKAVKPKKLIKNAIKIDNSYLIINNDVYDLRKYKRIIIIGGGKATAQMASTLENLISTNFPELSYKGLINVPEGLDINRKQKHGKIVVNYASHPIPNNNGLRGVKKMMRLIEDTKEEDLIIALISGGGSALLPYPKDPIKLEDLKKTNSLLLESGANIHEINAIRKHLSNFKGGNLARKIYESNGATLISLIISDVVGNDLDSIASGPTVPDSTTYKYAVEILEKYNLINRIPQSVENLLRRGEINPDLENPKLQDPCFENVYNYLIGSVDIAVDTIQKYLSLRKFDTIYFSDKIVGEARDFAQELYDIIKNEENLIKNGETKKLALIGSGELTVTIRGNGIGGRNQEMVLSLLNIFKKKDFSTNILVLGGNLDGIEGNSKAMGAFIDNIVINKAKNTNLEHYLKNNDSNSFFKKVGTEIITGQTGCNVNDVILVLLGEMS